MGKFKKFAIIKYFVNMKILKKSFKAKLLFKIMKIIVSIYQFNKLES